MKKIIFLSALIFFSIKNYSQNITGKVVNSRNQPLQGVTVRITGTTKGVFTSADGRFSLEPEPGQTSQRLEFSFLGYRTLDTIVRLPAQNLVIVLRETDYELEQVETYGYLKKDPGTVYLRGKLLEVVPTATDNAVEALIMTSMGVQATNELSSQYNVRGGNYDENLVYINGIKVFRPVLLRSSQQEGLSVINPDLVENIKFSAGGFSAEYGDKMSSVLDITYRTPDSNASGFYAGLTGLGFFNDFVTKSGKLTSITGVRLKQNTYLLNALPTKGNYRPLFADFQNVIQFTPSEKFRVKLFNYLAYNKYNFVPDSLTLAIGTFTQNFRLPVYFTGNESDLYASWLSALQFFYKPAYNLQISYTASYYTSAEQEKYTFNAAYRLDMVDREFTGNTDSAVNIGVGSFIDYGRNFLNLTVIRNTARINYELRNHSLVLGLEHQFTSAGDMLTRWKYVDSAGYSFSLEPQDDNTIAMYNYQSATNHYRSWRIDAFLTDYMRFYLGTTQVKLNAGLRYIYWQYAGEHQLNPRLSLYLNPAWQQRWTFRFSTGLYSQVPFYNDLRDLDGSLTQNPHSQKSMHVVAGAYRNFKLWDRPFRFTTEWYYKYLYDIIPFEYDNMRIQYYANQRAKGFAYGADFRLFGEFVPGTDSWISLSLMHTAEDIEDDAFWQYYDADGNVTSYKPLAVDSVWTEPGYIPRPTDQILTVGMFFQDYMPQNRDMRVSLGLFYGSGRPYGPPGNGRQYATLRMPAYLRADIGFLYLWHPQFANLVIFELDLLNAFDALNVASYSWLSILTNPALLGNPLTDAYMVQIAVPNYLTGRIINFKVKVKF